MNALDRPDDFETRRAHLRNLSDEALHARFWDLAERIVAPLIAEARTHTTPAIERSVLLRMGFTSSEARALTDGMMARQLLGHGSGKLLADLANTEKLTIRQAGENLLAGRFWDVLVEEGEK